jgi:hypothetical protein
MTEIVTRAYTVSEIDRMRRLTKNLYEMGGSCGDVSAIEDRLRTYMVAGITPEALEQEIKTRAADLKKQDEEARARFREHQKYTANNKTQPQVSIFSKILGP